MWPVFHVQPSPVIKTVLYMNTNAKTYEIRCSESTGRQAEIPLLVWMLVGLILRLEKISFRKGDPF